MPSFASLPNGEALGCGSNPAEAASKSLVRPLVLLLLLTVLLYSVGLGELNLLTRLLRRRRDPQHYIRLNVGQWDAQKPPLPLH
jgi:hypothetical protein